MSAWTLFALSVAVYAGVPMLCAAWPGRLRLVLLYTHLAAVLTLGGLLGAVYIVEVTDGVSLLAGQIAYGGFMFSTLVTTVVERDVQAVRNIAVLVVAVDLVVYLLFVLTSRALAGDTVLNPLGVPPALFEQSLSTVVIGGVLIIVELLLILAALEVAKKWLGPRAMGPVYVAAFVAVVALDGVLFPTLALRPPDGLGALVLASVQAKLVLAAAFAVPLVVFVAAYRPTVRDYERSALHLSQVLSVSRDDLIARLDRQQAEIEQQRSSLLRSTRHAGRAVATTEEIFHAATTTVIFSTDAELVITHFSTGAEGVLGYHLEELAGRTPAILHTDDEIARHAADLGCEATYAAVVHAQVAGGHSRDWEFRNAAGEPRMISLGISRIVDDDVVVGFVAAGEDVTTRVRTELAVRDALRREHASLVRLREVDQVKQELVSTVSHELRTPISSISGYTELLSDESLGPLSGEQRDAVARIERNTARLHQLVDDLITSSRLESGQLALDLAEVDVAEIVRGASDLVAELARGRDLDLRFVLPDTPALALGDGAALERVVVNLAGNAVKFTEPGGRVEVAVSSDGRRTRLEVTDTGIGISVDDREMLFSRFYRAPEAGARAIPGSGLGLSIVQAIVLQLDGDIEVSSAVGEGTTVRVTLPCPALAPQQEGRVGADD